MTNLDNLTRPSKLERASSDQLRRVDAMLAEKVHGMKCETHCVGCGEEFDGFEEHIDWSCSICGYQYGYDPTAPHYTTDLAAALSLLEKVSKDWAVYFEPEGFYECWLYDYEYAEGQASTLPFAIVASVIAAEGLDLEEVLGDGD